MNDKTKDAVDYFGGVWPYGDKEVIIASTKNAHDLNLGCAEFNKYKLSFDVDGLWYEGLEVWQVVCTKQQFEDYVKEQKMEKQKYKYVPVTDMSIWQLGQAIVEGGEFYDTHKVLIEIDNSKLRAETVTQMGLALQLEKGKITTRQPLPWYEVEGVFPCLVRCNTTGKAYLAEELDCGDVVIPNDGHIPIDYCTPLTPEEAAEYGVE